MAKIIVVSNIEIEVNKKNIKNMYLKVSRNDGKVRISSPLRMKDEDIMDFACNKIDWIKKQIDMQENIFTKSVLNYEDGEIHYLWGKPYKLEINHLHKNKVDIIGSRLIISYHKDSSYIDREKLLTQWYRKRLIEMLPQLFEKWEGIIGVKAESVRVRDMKTRWGSCNTRDKRIWINVQLAKKPIICLEYVVVHELVHLLEGSHNAVFKKHMDMFLPDWRIIKKELNSN